jgi:peptidoglycan/LPS O-acetylase OafA/YrhL
MSSSGKQIPFIFGLRGIASVYVLLYHLDYIVLTAIPHDAPRMYHALTDWIRYGDFRVAAFFVISGYLLTIPVTKSADWRLSQGAQGFLKRRAERLLVPYYVGFAISLVLYIAWKLVVHSPIHPATVVAATVSHVLLIHNIFPQTMFLVNGALWNVALEIQCYVLFAFVMLPLLRRFGPWRQFAIIVIASFIPHFVFHGFLDWMRLWFVALYAGGVATAAIANRAHPELERYERKVPWGTIGFVAFVLTPIAVWASGIDTSFGDGWLANLLLGTAVCCFMVYTRMGTPGPLGGLARAAVRFLNFHPLRRIGAFSYSIYLIHWPILQLLVGATARFTDSSWIVAGLALFVYVPLTLWLAFLFHVRVERPFQERRPAVVKAEPFPIAVNT